MYRKTTGLFEHGVDDGICYDCDGCGKTLVNSDGYSVYGDETALDDEVLGDMYTGVLRVEMTDGSFRYFCSECWESVQDDFPLDGICSICWSRIDPTHCIEYLVDWEDMVVGTKVVTR